MSDVIGHGRARRGRRARRGFLWFVGLVVGPLLSRSRPSTPLAQADPPVFDGKEIKDLCTISASGQCCPPFPPPPGLLNPGALAAAGPSDRRRRCATWRTRRSPNTLADHQLPASDRDAALSWARTTPSWAVGSDRRGHQTPAGPAHRRPAAGCGLDDPAGLRAAAGGGVAGGRRVRHVGRARRQPVLVDGPDGVGGRADDLPGPDVRTFSPRTPLAEATAATPHRRRTPCRLRRLALAELLQRLHEHPGLSGPDPDLRRLRGLGQDSLARRRDQRRTDAQAINIGLAAGFAAVAVGTALAAALSSAIVSAIGASIWVFAFGTAAVTSAAAAASSAAVATAIAAGATAAEASPAGRPPPRRPRPTSSPVAAGSAAGAAIAGAVLVVILAIVIAVIEGIRVFDNAALPGKIAQLVVGSRDARTDPATLMATTDGQKTLFYLFVGATMPLPRTGARATTRGSRRMPGPPATTRTSSCTSRWAATPRSLIPSTAPLPEPASDPAGRTDGCPLPGVSPGCAGGSARPGQPRPSTWVERPSRLHGNWFITSATGAPAEQTLRLQYVDWEGDDPVRVALPRRRRIPLRGAYHSTTTRPRSTPTPARTTAPAGSPTRSSTSALTAGVLGHRRGVPVLVGPAVVRPDQPVEASPVTFDAEDFAPGELDGTSPTPGGSSTSGVAGSSASAPTRACRRPRRTPTR